LEHLVPFLIEGKHIGPFLIEKVFSLGGFCLKQEIHTRVLFIRKS